MKPFKRFQSGASLGFTALKRGVNKCSKRLRVKLWVSRAIAPHVISRKRSIAFGQGSLADVVASKFFYALRGGQRGKRLTRINLSGRRDGFDARGAAHV